MTRPTHLLSTGLAAALLATLTPGLSAQDFVGLDSFTGEIFDIDTSSSTATSGGNLMGGSPFGFGPMDRGPDGTLYALVPPFFGNGFDLYTIDENTNTASLLWSASGANSSGTVGIAVDPDGTSIWVVGFQGFSLLWNVDEVDLVTGVATPRGGGGGNIWGLGFDAAGDLFTLMQSNAGPTTELVLVNQIDAAASVSLGVLAGFMDFNAGYAIASERGSGSLHAIERETDIVYSIDTTAVTATAISGALAGGMNIFDFAENPVESFTLFCNGDGGDQMGCTDCPCGNNAMPGTVGGCMNSFGSSASLNPSGTPEVGNDSMRFEVTGATPMTFGILQSADNQLPNMSGCPVGSGILSPVLDGLRCVGGNALRHGTRMTDASGDIGLTTAGWGPPNGPAGGLIAFNGFVMGQTRHFQVFYREDVMAGCLTGQNTTNACSVTFQ